MYKVFLAEDEYVIRNGIKNSISWKDHNLEFVGEASDGELAYPMILKEKPDILITDIKMPFMNGLELSREVKKELPDIKILILSGYNEFDYARQAISIGITDYLLKPVSAEKLLNAISEVTDLIEKEREEKKLLARYIQDMQENVEFAKFQFFTRLVTENLSLSQTLEEGKRLGMNLGAGFYNLMLFKIQNLDVSEEEIGKMVQASVDIEEAASGQPFVCSFRRGVEGWAFLVLGGDLVLVEENMQKWEETLRGVLKEYPGVHFFGSKGYPVERIRELKEVFRVVDETFSYRFLEVESKILSFREGKKVQEELNGVQGYVAMEDNRKLMERFLRNGTREEVSSFAEVYFKKLPEEDLASALLRQYIMIDIYISVMTFAASISVGEDEVKEKCGDIQHIMSSTQDTDSLKSYVENLLIEILQIRDTVSMRRYANIISKAKSYISQNYMSEDISLARVSSMVNMSPSYFSTIFSQETGRTFVECLTEVRMAKAKELLMCSTLKSTEIGFEVGYKDSHYFSYLFRKTQGCSPREYRLRGKDAE